MVEPLSGSFQRRSDNAIDAQSPSPPTGTTMDEKASGTASAGGCDPYFRSRAPENRALMATEADKPAMRALAPEEANQVSGGHRICNSPPQSPIVRNPLPDGPILHGPIDPPWKPIPPGPINQWDYSAGPH